MRVISREGPDQDTAFMQGGLVSRRKGGIMTISRWVRWFGYLLLLGQILVVLHTNGLLSGLHYAAGLAQEVLTAVGRSWTVLMHLG